MMFFDSYAIIEIINLNQKYLKFADEVIVTNSLNLAEVYYALLKTSNKKTADYLISKFDFRLIDITKELSLEAAKFRFDNRKKKISFADAIGYVTALKLGMKFLTGDKEFESLENVEFVK